MNQQITSFLTSSLFLFCLALPAKSETVLERIQRTGVLKVAIREDAPPFGYIDANNNLQGYCLDFFAVLEKQLSKNLERNTLSIKLLKSTPTNRFSLISKNIVDLECGPNTIRSDIPEDTDFSTSFFVTGTQFLIKQNSRDRLEIEQDLNNMRLGVINRTTTEKFIAERYPLATIQRFSGVKARIRGIQAVEQNKLDAMVSDGILLRAQAQQQGLSSSEYPLIPEIPLSCDRYGMIIKGNDSQWQDFINSVINSLEAVNLSNTWFGRLFNYTQAAQSFCE
ncbi:MAG: amino acid ABC transporter substrate-binding protein [Pleurocapsa sp. MO_192.B19]|nr:amino acid ABC transporter substrate-binding protein [Pleurocapsa sp. MO_192.B19]